MSDKKQKNQRLQKAQTLRQTHETWSGICCLAPFWIVPDYIAPYRPFIFCLVDEGSKVLRTNTFDQDPSTNEIFAEILHGICRPILGSGRARRPEVLFFDNSDLADALTPLLSDLDIRCELRHSLPVIKKLLYSMEKQINRREPIPGLLTIPSITKPFMSHLYELAADFYTATPWNCLNDRNPIEIRVTPAKEPRYAVVMGSGGEVFGLAVYDYLDDLLALYNSSLSNQQLTKKFSTLVLFFEEARAMGFEDLDAMEANGWSVIDEQGYPIFGRSTPLMEIQNPSKADLFWMEGALAGILKYLSKHTPVESFDWIPPDETVSVKLIGGEAQTKLRFLNVDELLSGHFD